MLRLRVCHATAPLPYTSVWQTMRAHTLSRTPDTPDTLWLMEHLPVFTQGQAGKPEHIIDPHDIPVVHTDRGGQVTYHGPGQLMIYTLCDLERLQLGVNAFVRALEKMIMEITRTHLNLTTTTKDKAPGIYTQEGHKFCSIGLRVRRGRSYHGLCLNVSGDLHPFTYIHPCGYPEQHMTQLAAFSPDVTLTQTAQWVQSAFVRQFGYQQIEQIEANNEHIFT